MLAALRRDFRLAPVTFLLLAASVVLFFAVEWSQVRGDDPMKSGRRAFGAVVGQALVSFPEIHGPFDLWDGPWWRWLRIPASAFHHGGIVHLICNLSFLWFLGPLLERRMSWWRYLAFWFFAAMIPLLPEFLLGNEPVGLSGVACAMFGWCLIERHFDHAVSSRVNDKFVQFNWFFLIGCVVATAAGLASIANVAHFAGVALGWLMAESAHRRSVRYGTILVFMLAIPMTYVVLHPFWNGRYHGYRGFRAEKLRNDLKTAAAHYATAIRWEPGLALPWKQLALMNFQQQQYLEAWKIAVQGLKTNRSSTSLEKLVQDIWVRLPEGHQTPARVQFKEAFGNDAKQWSQRLGMTRGPTKVDPEQDQSASEGQLL